MHPLAYTHLRFSKISPFSNTALCRRRRPACLSFAFVFLTLLVRHIGCLSLLPCIRVYKPPRLALPRQGKNRRNRSPFLSPTFRVFSRDRGLTPLITSVSLIPNSPLGFPSLPPYTCDG